MYTSHSFFTIMLLTVLLTSSLSAADPNIVEVPNSISPATVVQWSRLSFSIDVKNLDGDDIQLDPNTKLRFGMGTGHPYTNMIWSAIDENLCWVNLTEQIVIPANQTRTLVFERALVCGELPPDTYHPQLELTGTYANSGTPFSQTLYTQANPITVTYWDRPWSLSCGCGPAGAEFLFTPNGGYFHYSYPSYNYLQLLEFVPGIGRDPAPMQFEWTIGLSAESDAKNYRVDLQVLCPDCSIISEEDGPPQKFRIFVDNFEIGKRATSQFAAYMNDLTVLGRKYSDQYSVECIHSRCPHQTGIYWRAAAGVRIDVVFDDNVDLEISSMVSSQSSLRWGEVLDVNITVENTKVYPIFVDLSPDQTYLTFTSEGSEVSSFFDIAYPTVDEIPALSTQTLTFSFTPVCAVPLGLVTVDPTIRYFNYFADGEDMLKLSGEETGSLYPTPVTTTFEMLSDVSGVVYVNKAAPLGGDGALWNTAYQTIQGGIDAACYDTEVWVTSETYSESIKIKSGVKVYGGFQGTEQYLWERDVVENATIIDANTADAGGPANHVVLMDSITNARIDGFTITGGAAHGSSPHGCGGGIYCNIVDETNVLANLKVLGNFAQLDGGGLYCDNSSPTITNCSFSENTGSYGGGMAISSGSPNLTNCTFNRNTSVCGGGGMYNKNDSNPILTNCTFIRNSSGDGGGMYSDDSNPILTKCLFRANSSNSTGGGMYNGGGATLTNCTFSANWARQYGGGIYNSGSSIVTGCLFSGNSAAWGGSAMCNGSCSPILINCTISGNSSGIRNSHSSPILSNCILWDNMFTEIRNDSASAAVISYSNIQGGCPGLGNIDAEPCFASPGYWDANGTPGDPEDDFWVDGDYHLKSQAGRWDPNSQSWVSDDVTSRCIDAGSPGSPLGDEPNDVNNLRLNMGAYGSTAEASMPPYGWSLLSDITNDGTVDFVDFSHLAIIFTDQDVQFPGDFDRDSDVGLADLAFLAADWLDQTTWH